MSKKLKVFTLTKSRWLRGSDVARQDVNVLCRNDWSGCCLGLFGLQCGVTKTDLLNKTMPGTVDERFRTGDFALLADGVLNTPAAIQASIINDSSSTTDSEKIRALRPIFRRLGYRIVVAP